MIGLDQVIAWQDPVTVLNAAAGDSAEHELDLSGLVADNCNSVFLHVRTPYQGGVGAENTDFRILQNSGEANARAYSLGRNGTTRYNAPMHLWAPLGPDKKIIYRDMAGGAGTAVMKLFGQLLPASKLTGTFWLKPDSTTLLSGGTATAWTTVSTGEPEAIGVIARSLLYHDVDTLAVVSAYLRRNSEWSDYLLNTMYVGWARFTGQQVFIPLSDGDFDYKRVQTAGSGRLNLYSSYYIMPGKNRFVPTYRAADWSSALVTVLSGGTATSFTKVTVPGAPPYSLVCANLQASSSSYYDQAYARDCSGLSGPQHATSRKTKDIDVSGSAIYPIWLQLDENSQFEYQATSGNAVYIYAFGWYPPI